MAYRRLTALLVAAVALLCALPDWAAAAANEQKSIFEPQFDLGLWTIIVFIVLLLVLKRYAWGPMLEGLRTREEAIRGAVEEAKVARAETERHRVEFERRLAEAHAEIPKLMEAARRDAQKLADDMRARATADIQTERQRAHREIATAKDQALKELTDHVSQLATLVSAKAIRRSLSAEDHRRLLDDALDELKQAPKQP